MECGSLAAAFEAAAAKLNSSTSSNGHLGAFSQSYSQFHATPPPSTLPTASAASAIPPSAPHASPPIPAQYPPVRDCETSRYPTAFPSPQPLSPIPQSVSATAHRRI